MRFFSRRGFLATTVAAGSGALFPSRQVTAGEGALSTGFAGLDRLVGGLNRGWLVLVTGYPSIGKTALVLSMALRTAVRDRLGACFVSPELSQSELAERLLCSRAGVARQALRYSRLSEGERQCLIRSAAELSASPLWVYDQPLSPAGLRNKVHQINRWFAPDRLRLLVVDPLQGFDDERQPATEGGEARQLTSGLKALAVELGLTVVGTVPTSRGSGSFLSPMQELSDLRVWSTSCADLVIVPHRPGFGAPQQRGDPCCHANNLVSACCWIPKSDDGLLPAPPDGAVSGVSTPVQAGSGLDFRPM